jgi:hypothetical protein
VDHAFLVNIGVTKFDDARDGDIEAAHGNLHGFSKVYKYFTTMTMELQEEIC